MAKRRKKILYNVSFLLFLLLVSLLSFSNLSRYLAKPQMVLAATSNVDEEILFWQEFSDRNPTYLDAFLELSQLSAKKGNIKLARQYLFLAQKVNPNSQRLIKVRKTLGL